MRKYLVEAVNGLDKPVLDKVAVSLNEAVQDAEKYMAKNKETIEWYMTLKNSDEYKQTPEYRLQSLFRQFNENSGYIDVFIPAMKELSSSYRQHHDNLLKADKAFSEEYPNINDDR